MSHLIKYESVINCPECGEHTQQVMPDDSCQFFFQCPNCDTVLKPEGEDCCVFCSYGSVPCPPVQAS